MIPTTSSVVTTGQVAEERVLDAIARLRELPFSAPVVHKALAHMADPDFEMAGLKVILSTDQAVAARILRLANSAYFGFRSEVQTVSQAVVLLGQNRIRTLLRRILSDKLLTELGHGAEAATAVRRTSLATATASCVLSQLLVQDDPEEALLAGLLHNIGDLFYLSQFPLEFERVREGEPPESVFPMTSGRAGKRLLETWYFPPLYPAVAEHAGDPVWPECPPDWKPAVSLVHTGLKIAHAYIAGAEPSTVLPSISADVAASLHLDDGLVAEVYHTLPQRMSFEQLQAGRS